MAVVLGELLLDLGIDMTRYDEQILEAEQKAFSLATRIQSIVEGVSIEAPSFNDNLQLTPRVDDSQLTALNQHLNLKRKHFQDVNQYFSDKPLTPKVNDAELTALNQRISELKKGYDDLSAQLAKRTAPSIDSTPIDEFIAKIQGVSRESDRVNDHLKSNPLSSPSDPSGISTGIDGLNDFRQRYDALVEYVNTNPIAVRVDTSELAVLERSIYGVQDVVDQTNTRLQSNPVMPGVDVSEFDKVGRKIAGLDSELDGLSRKSVNIGVQDSLPKTFQAVQDSAVGFKNFSEGKPVTESLKAVLDFEQEQMRRAKAYYDPSSPSGYRYAEEGMQGRFAPKDVNQRKIIVEQKQQGIFGKVADTAIDKVVSKAVDRATELAVQEAAVQFTKIGTKALTSGVDIAAEAFPVLKIGGIDKKLKQGISAEGRKLEGKSTFADAKEGELRKAILRLSDAFERGQITEEQYIKSLGKVNKELVEVKGDRTGKAGIGGFIGSTVKNIGSGLTELLTAPARSALSGFYEGIGNSYAEAFAAGAIKQFEETGGTSLEDLGRKAATGVGARFSGAGAVQATVNKISGLSDIESAIAPVMEKYGFGGGGKPLSVKAFEGTVEGVQRVSNILDKSIDAETAQQDVDAIKQSVMELAQAIIQLDDVSGSASNLGEALQAAAMTPVDSVISTYKQSARDSAMNLEARLGSRQPESIEELTDKQERIVFASAGFSATGGKNSNPMADRIQAALGETAKVIAFENEEFETQKDATKDGVAAWMGDVIGVVTETIERGYNPASVRMAMEAAAYAKANPDTPIDLIGHSAGGLIAKEAQAVLKEMGIDVGVTSIATPTMGAFATEGDRTMSVLGKGDFFRYASPGAGVIEDVAGHEFSDYIQSDTIKDLLRERVGRNTLAAYSDAAKSMAMPTAAQVDIPAQAELEKQIAEPKIQPSGQMVEKPTQTYRVKFNDELQTFEEAVERVSKTTVRFDEATGEFVESIRNAGEEIKRSFENISLPDMSGLELSPMELEEITGSAGAVQSTSDVGQVSGGALQGSDALSQAAESLARAEEMATRESESVPAANLGELSDNLLKQSETLSQVVEGLAKAEEAIAKEVASPPEERPLLATPRQLELGIGDFGQGAQLQGQVQVGTALGESSQSLLRESQELSQAIEQVARAQEAAGEGILATAQSLRQGDVFAGIEQLEIDFAAPAAAEIVPQVQTALDDSAQIVAQQGEQLSEALEEAAQAEEVAAKEVSVTLQELQEKLESLTRVKLQGMAKSFDLKGYSRLNKADLIDRIIEGADPGQVDQKASEEIALKEMRELEKTITALNRKAKEMTGDKQIDAASEVRQMIIEAVDSINELLGPGGAQTGAIRSNLGGIKGRLEQRYLETIRGASPEQVKKAAESMGQNVSLGLSQGLSLKDAEEAARRMAQEVIEASEDEFGIQSPSKVFEKIGEYISLGLKKGLDKAEQIIGPELFGELIEKGEEESKAIAETAQEGMGELFASLKSAGPELDSIFPGISGMIDRLSVSFETLSMFGSQALTVLFSYKALGFLKNLFVDITRSAIAASNEFEQMKLTLNFASGGSAIGAKNLERVRDQVKALNGDIRAAVSGYTGLVAASRGTSMEGDITNDTFRGVLTASTAYQLDPQQQERVFLALQQIISKGTVSAEELRQQLGEALPGAFQISARAMGVTTAELSKMLETGQLMAEDFLPKLAAQLEAETSSGLAAAADSAQAGMNRLNNSVFELRANLGEPLQPAQKLGLNTMAQIIEVVDEHALTFVKTIGILTTIMGVALVKAIVAATQAVNQFLVSTGLMPKVIGVTKAAINGLKDTLKQVAGAFLVMYVGVETITAISNAWSKGGGEINDFADQAEKSMEKYRLSLSKAMDGTEEFAEMLPKLASEIEGATLFDGTIIQTLVGQQGSRFIENALITALETTPLGIGINGIAQATGRDGIMTVAERQSLQSQEARDRLATQASLTSSEIYTLSGIDGQGVGVVSQVNELDEQIRALQVERRSLGASEGDRRRDLDTQISSVLDERNRLAEPIDILKAKNAADIQNLEAAIAELESVAAAGGVTQDVYVRQSSGLRAELDAAMDAQELFNNIVGQSIDQLSLLRREFQEIDAVLQDKQIRIELQAAIDRQTVGQLRVQGLDGQAASLEGQFNAENLRARIRANEVAMESARAALADSAIRDALQNTGIAGDINQIGAAELANRAGRLTEGSEERGRLELAADQKSQLEQTEIETENLRAELIEAEAIAQQRLRDAAHQIRDFYESIERSAEQLELEAQSTEAQLDTQRQQNKLREALIGFTDSFLDGTVDSLIQLLDTLNQPLQETLNAERQILDIQNQLTDQIRQGRELERSLPTEFLTNGQPIEQEDLSRFMPGSASPSGEEQQYGRSDPFALGSVGQPQVTQPANDLVLPSQGEFPEMPEFSNAQIQDAMAMAENSAQRQLELAIERRDVAIETSQIEANLQIEGLLTQFEQARDEMEDTAQSFQSSFESIRQNIGQNNPMRELGNSLRDVSRNFIETEDSLLDFQERLENTVAVGRQELQLVEGLVASGQISQEVADRLLPEIQATIDVATQQLNDAASMIAENRLLAEAQRRDAVRNRGIDVNTQIVERATGLLRQGGGDLAASGIEAELARIQQGQLYQGQIAELEQLRAAGEITGQEFEMLYQSVSALNDLEMQGTQSEQNEQILSQMEAASQEAQALQEYEERITAEKERQLDLISQAVIAQGQLAEDAEDQLDTAIKRLELAEEFGLVDSDRANQFRGAAELVRDAIQEPQQTGPSFGRDEMDGDRRLLQAALDNQGNQFFNTLLGQVGRGDILQLAGLRGQLENPYNVVEGPNLGSPQMGGGNNLQAQQAAQQALQNVERLGQESLEDTFSLDASPSIQSITSNVEKIAMNGISSLANAPESATSVGRQADVSGIATEISNNNADVVSGLQQLNKTMMEGNRIMERGNQQPRSLTVVGAENPGGTIVDVLSDMTKMEAARGGV